MSPRPRPAPLLVVGVEEFHQDPALGGIVLPAHRQRFERRVAGHLRAWLQACARSGARATFVVGSEIEADTAAALAAASAAGHEVEPRGFAGLPLPGAAGEAWRAPMRRLPAALWVGGEGLRRGDWPAVQRELNAAWAAGTSLVFAFASWEIDAGRPVVRAAGGRIVASHYDGAGVFAERLAWCLQTFGGMPVSVALGLPAPPPLPAAAVAAAPAPPSPAGVAVRTRVAIVVPLLDEEEAVPYLLRTLELATGRLRDRHEFEFVFVDDGSSDRTWPLLEQAAATRADIVLARHERNRGVAAAIQTGIRAASTEVVCSIDGDCSYDPAELEHMLPLLADADLVTASPYHPRGTVRNVPGWRLLLSKGLSAIYRVLLRRRICTWTSCFRVYRRAAVADLPLDHPGFLGIAELLIRLVRRGGRVVEHPAVLESRLLGVSKMKTLRTVRQHLGLCWNVLRGRVR